MLFHRLHRVSCSFTFRGLGFCWDVVREHRQAATEPLGYFGHFQTSHKHTDIWKVEASEMRRERVLVLEAWSGSTALVSWSSLGLCSIQSGTVCGTVVLTCFVWSESSRGPGGNGLSRISKNHLEPSEITWNQHQNHIQPI